MKIFLEDKISDLFSLLHIQKKKSSFFILLKKKLQSFFTIEFVLTLKELEDFLKREDYEIVKIYFLHEFLFKEIFSLLLAEIVSSSFIIEEQVFFQFKILSTFKEIFVLQSFLQSFFIRIFKGKIRYKNKLIFPFKVVFKREWLKFFYFRSRIINKTIIFYLVFKLKMNLEKIMNFNKVNFHEVIGRSLFYFLKLPTVSKFEVLWLQQGLILLNNLKKIFLLNKKEYFLISSPSLVHDCLLKKTGHLSNYNNFLFKVLKVYTLKPMNCPFAGLVYQFLKKKSNLINFSLKIFEFGKVNRKELTGSKNGLKRISIFTQDDTHIFYLSLSNLKLEIKLLLREIIQNYFFNFDFFNFIMKFSSVSKVVVKEFPLKIKLSEKILLSVLKEEKWNFSIAKEEGAFYGPKIDFCVLDYNDKEWQLATLQLDFFLAERLSLKEVKVVVHSACAGSLERFLAIQLEKNFGFLPCSFSDRNLYLLVEEEIFKEKILQELLKLLSILKFQTNINLSFIVKKISSLKLFKVSQEVRKSIFLKYNFFLFIGKKDLELNILKIRNNRLNKINIIKISNFKVFLLETFLIFLN